uniref:A-kinase anchor protein 2-like n=1 Tax=Loa loa TaxID=7209 RepID=A0A1I7W4Y6_LOALO
MVQPAEEIIEKAVKPEVEEKIERAIEEFEETEITLDCEKQQEQEMIHVSILTVASESAQASVRLAKENQLKHQCACIRGKRWSNLGRKIIEKAVSQKWKRKLKEQSKNLKKRKSHLIAKTTGTRNDSRLHSDCGFRISSSDHRKPEVEEKIERAIEEFEETEITLDCEKQQEQEMIHISILTGLSESAQASVRLVEEAKMVQHAEEIIEKAVKPEEQEMIHVHSDCGFRISSSISALARRSKDGQPAEEIIEKALKPEVEEKIERAIEEFEETEITLDCEKATGTRNDSHLHSDWAFRISSSISALAREVKMVPTAEEIIEKAVKPEVEEKIERAIEEFEETEITLDCEKQQEQEMIHVSILTVASESAQASVRLAKEVKMVQPAEEDHCRRNH